MTESAVRAVPGMPHRQSASDGVSALMIVLPIVVVLMAVAFTVGGVMVVPLGDLTPVVVLSSCLLARRLEGAYLRLFDAAAILAGLLMIEWLLAYGLLLCALTLASAVLRQQIVTFLGSGTPRV